MFLKNEALNNKIDQLKHLKYLDILDMMSTKVSFLCCKILENKKKDLKLFKKLHISTFRNRIIRELCIVQLGNMKHMPLLIKVKCTQLSLQHFFMHYPFRQVISITKGYPNSISF